MKQNIQAIWLRTKHELRSLKIISNFFICLQAQKAKRSRISFIDVPDSAPASSYRCHIMVTKSISYVFLSEICVNSFLQHHNSSTFVIHTDRLLACFLRFRFSGLIKEGRVEIVDCVKEKERWQLSKLRLILAMNGTSDIFMDADLRWNGTLAMNDSIQFYLREFQLVDIPVYKLVFGEVENFQNTFMYNLSFFSFSNWILTDKQLDEILSLENEIFGLNSSKISALEILGMRRMSEQLALSIALCGYDIPLGAIKSSDTRNDGTFVESCYFGATGLAF